MPEPRRQVAGRVFATTLSSVTPDRESARRTSRLAEAIPLPPPAGAPVTAPSPSSLGDGAVTSDRAPRMTTTLRRQVVKRCPFRDETDTGELVITIAGDAPELHNLATQVDRLTAEPVSHEEFTAAVAGMLPGAQVVTRWRTGPWDVEVAATAP